MAKTKAKTETCETKQGCKSCFVVNLFALVVAVLLANGLREMSQIERDIASVPPSLSTFMQSDVHPIVLYDGVCNLCNGVVQTLLKLDTNDVFRFAPLQSPIGEQLLEANGLPNDLSTVVYIESGLAFRHSSAAIRILKHLPFPLNLLYGLIAVPAPVRDYAYGLISVSRYQLFGHTEQCLAPSEALRHRFLDQQSENPFCL